MKFDGTLPNNWLPRSYQVPFIRYMLSPGEHKHAELVWHRRSGKDDCCLQVTALMIHAAAKPATYWHMLPEATQARKAIWDAIDPHTGVRRVDWAFPPEIRRFTRDKEMMIGFKNGATWQVVGSDNYNSLVGSTLGGVVFSEWPIANPAARGFIRPILRETHGWQVYNGTPRGRNHGYDTYEAAKRTPGVFAQLLTANDTGLFDEEALLVEKQEYLDLYGEEVGEAFFRQEYFCSFDISAVGAVYGGEINRVRKEGRVRDFATDSALPVHIVCDLGFRDASAFWFFQVGRDELRVVDYLEASLLSIEDYISLIHEKRLPLSHQIWLPHDARARSLQTGKSIEEQFRSAGFVPRIVPQLSIMDGIAAARKTFPRAVFHARVDESGLKLLGGYHYEWDEKLRVFRPAPAHDYCSHAGDAWRYLAIAWREMKEEPAPAEEQPVGFKVPIRDMIKQNAQTRNRGQRRW